MKLGPDSTKDFQLNIHDNDKIAIVKSKFNTEITNGLEQGAIKTLQELGFNKDKQIKVFEVSGAVEIPLVAKVALKTKKYLGVLTLGAIIRGDTPHFDYVCQMVSSSLAHLSLETERPVGFGILTTDNLIQANERSKDDEFNKGRETALAVIRQLKVIQQIHQNR